MEKITGVINAPHNKKEIIYDIRYKANAKPKIPVIFIHGFKGFKDWGTFNLLSEYFANNNFIFLKFNFSHNGTTLKSPINFKDLEAFGKNNFLIELDDLEKIINLLIEGDFRIPDYEISYKKLCLTGHSRGGSIAILKAAENENIKAITSWSAVSDFEKRWSKEMLEDWKENGVYYVKNARTGQQMPLYYQLAKTYFENKDRLYIPAKAEKIKQPTLILHGEKDEAVPVSMARELHEYIENSELKILNNTGHTFDSYHPYEQKVLPEKTKEAADLTIDFFKRTLDQTQSKKRKNKTI